MEKKLARRKAKEEPGGSDATLDLSPANCTSLLENWWVFQRRI